MVNAAMSILKTLADQGYQLIEADETRFVYRPIGKKIPPDLYEQLKAHKSEILEYLRAKPANSIIHVTAVEAFGTAIALTEVAGIAVTLLCALPCPPVLICSTERESGETIEFDFRKSGQLSKGRIYFSALEALELVAAVETRWPIDFRSYCRRKMREPKWFLDLKIAPSKGLAKSITVASFLARLGLKLTSIEIRP